MVNTQGTKKTTKILRPRKNTQTTKVTLTQGMRFRERSPLNDQPLINVQTQLKNDPSDPVKARTNLHKASCGPEQEVESISTINMLKGTELTNA